MIHHRQRLPLGLEPRDDLAGVHPDLDDLQCDAAADRVLLLGHEDDAEPAFADLLQELVSPDRGAGTFADGDERVQGHVRGRRLENVARGGVGGEERLDTRPQLGVVAAGVGKERRAPGRRRLQRFREDRFDTRRFDGHA